RGDKRLGFVTGDREDIRVGDIWVNSENTNMQMDRYYGESTSATLRYLGARKDDRGKVVEDTINDELQRKMAGAMEVDPGTVLATSAGELADNNVKWIFHVAAVTGQPREDYRSGPRPDQCVKNALRKVGRGGLRDSALQSILFPIFGPGPAGGDLQQHATICINAALEYLETVETPIRDVYFYVWSDVDLEICQAIVRNHPGLASH